MNTILAVPNINQKNFFNAIMDIKSNITTETDTSKKMRKAISIHRDRSDMKPGNSELSGQRKRTYPLPVTSQSQNTPNVFERLYNGRHKPTEVKVESVRKQYEERRKSMLNRRESITNPPSYKKHEFNEPPKKKICQRSSTFATDPNGSVFERLYAQRKQLNHKRLTDHEKRTLYLAMQKEEIKRAQVEWIKKKKRKSNDSHMDKTSCKPLNTTGETSSSHHDTSLDSLKYTTNIDSCVKLKKQSLNDDIIHMIDMLRNIRIELNKPHLKRQNYMLEYC
ncbi:hypothetical protein GWI33_020019 [Rhynchophorus ferrugineus]|uniref:Uncharacterized protein n=1 Tax=Rhynchophorus ferrugineus TaxID=354439 RepID=A0A834HQ99_RHYFE|nr:hypothetical protein GWI33_020019 [Rhynchophorus ferrugineus]